MRLLLFHDTIHTLAAAKHLHHCAYSVDVRIIHCMIGEGTVSFKPTPFRSLTVRFVCICIYLNTLHRLRMWSALDSAVTASRAAAAAKHAKLLDVAINYDAHHKVCFGCANITRLHCTSDNSLYTTACIYT
jgi:hypothetical protein